MSDNYFSFGDIPYDHFIGNENCPYCWDRPLEKCESCKAGLIHTQFGDENNDGDYWLYYKCDKCGELGGN